MKTVVPILLASLFASAALAEQGTAGPPVAVLKYEWAYMRDLGLDSGVPDMSAPDAGDRELPRGRARQSRTWIAAPNVLDDVGREPRPRRDSYRYTVAIRNLAERAIQAVVWEYVIVDPRSHAELARLRFTTAKKISPGKTRKLAASTWTPPTQTMSVQGLQHRNAPRAGESVEICEIRYSDGSLWVRR